MSLKSHISHPHSAAIDIVKGLAIVSVIFLHTLPLSQLNRIGAVFHIWEAVPVFLFLMGFNGAASLRRRNGRSLRASYSESYLLARFDRVIVPFLLAFAGTMVLVALTHRAHYRPLGLVGDLLTAQLPIKGPGNYFIALVIQFALLFPALYLALRRWPLRVLLVCLAIDVAFEVIAPRTGFIKSHPYAYEVCLARYLTLLALGALCAGAPLARVLRSPWFWGGVLLSVAYLGLVVGDSSAIGFAERDWRGQTFAAAFYPALLVILGITLLPSVSRGLLPRVLERLGQASYHIFLVQIIWFGLVVWSGDSWPALLGNLAVTLPAGVLFQLAIARIPLPTLTGLVARHRLSAGKVS